jgi:tetratricopeptide (TPR) repeat protein
MRSAECGVRRDRHRGRRIIVPLLLAVVLAMPAAGADDPVQRAMKGYEKHHYEEAARELQATLPSLAPGKRLQAELVLGMICLRNAELHDELARTSAAISADYLKRLSAERGRSRSRYSDLYFGCALLESGKTDAALRPLERFAASGHDAKSTAMAKTAIGTATYLGGDKQKAQDIWNGIDRADADVKTEVAAAWSRTDAAGKNPPALCDEAITAGSRKNGRGSSIIVLKNCLGVYARAGQLDKARDLLRTADLKSYSYRESLGKSKVLSFYDIGLLDSLGAYYLQESLASLEKAAADPALTGIANYYLSEAYAVAGSTDRASKAAAVFLASPKAPAQYRSRALVRQGALQYRKGRKADAIGTWDDLVRTQKNDPALLAEVLVSCGELHVECSRVAGLAAAAAEAGQGRRFAETDIGLGRYYFSRKDYARALVHLEAGRDKGNKNKIEFNDPLMMVDLAESYYRSRKYSEALEIYFEMSKEFPQVRQVQEALQGIYSMEHRSAGDVKIN